MGLRATIRRAAPRDAPWCRRMASEFLEASPYGQILKQRDAVRLAGFVEWMLRCGLVFVAERNGEVIGMLATIATEVPITGDLAVEEIAWWVNPDDRDSTIGPRLLEALEAHVRTNHNGLLKMIAPGGSQVGRYLERRGYAAIETVYVRRFDEGEDGIQLPGGRRPT